MKTLAKLIIYGLLYVILQGGCMTDSKNKTELDSVPQNPVKFDELLRKDERVKQLAVEYAFTPPVPVEQSSEQHKVVVFSFRLKGLPPQAPRVLSPDYRVVADYPSGKVESIERVTPSQLDLTLNETGDLGEVQIPQNFKSLTYEENEKIDKEFHNIYADTLDAYLNNRSLSKQLCRRSLELLPIFAKSPLIPLLHNTSSSFFVAIERCASE